MRVQLTLGHLTLSPPLLEFGTLDPWIRTEGVRVRRLVVGRTFWGAVTVSTCEVGWVAPR